MEFSYKIREKSGVQVIQMAGKLMEKSQAENLLNVVAEKATNGKYNFVLDLSEMIHMNSTGLNVLINILTKSRNMGGEVVITKVPKDINKLLLITKLNTVFSVTDDLKSALTKFVEKAGDLK